MEKKIVLRYFLIGILLNILFTIVFIIVSTENRSGEIQLVPILSGVFGLISVFIYVTYFAIPEFKKEIEKFISILIPSILLIIGSVKFPEFLYFAIFNMILNIIFLIHFIKTRK